MTAREPGMYSVYSVYSLYSESQSLRAGEEPLLPQELPGDQGLLRQDLV